MAKAILKLKGQYQFAFYFLIVLCIVGCATAPRGPKKKITELYAPIYKPAYDFEPPQQQSQPTGYTIGIVNAQFKLVSIPERKFEINTAMSKKYVEDFIQAFSYGLEKIMTSKGITVAGPFESYEEMTYPQRKRCDFLIMPIVEVEVTSNELTSVSQLTKIPGYSGPNGENYIYATWIYKTDSIAEIDYVIFDPLAKEKLERHKLKSDTIPKSVTTLLSEYSIRNNAGEVTKTGYRSLDMYEGSYPNYHNHEVIVGEILDAIYSDFMPRINELVSVEEFDHLMKYKEELEKKKRY